MRLPTSSLAPKAVTYTIIQDVSATSRILLRKTAGSGSVEEGTIDDALAFATRTANTVLAGPTTGSAAAPTFRSLVAADLPALNGITAPTGNVSLNSYKITSLATGTADTDGVNVAQLNAAVAALAAKNDVQAATSAALPLATYSNGSSGVGATLTGNVAAVLVLDGYTPAVGDRLLIKNQANAAHNGLYTLTTVGTVIIQWVLTRTTDFDHAIDGINGALVYVLQGTTNANTLWSCTTDASITFGTTNINWSQFTGTTYTADESTLHLSGTTFSVLTNGVGNSQLAQMAANTIKGNNSGSTANASDLTVAQVWAMLAPRQMARTLGGF